MSSTDDTHNIEDAHKLLEEIEQGIRVANRELINKRVPELDKDMLLSFAVAVGRLRANYMEAAFRLTHGEGPSTSRIDDLRQRRQLFEEARLAFEHMRDAIEKGYLDIDTHEK